MQRYLLGTCLQLVGEPHVQCPVTTALRTPHIVGTTHIEARFPEYPTKQFMSTPRVLKVVADDSKTNYISCIGKCLLNRPSVRRSFTPKAGQGLDSGVGDSCTDQVRVSQLLQRSHNLSSYLCLGQPCESVDLRVSSFVSRLSSPMASREALFAAVGCAYCEALANTRDRVVPRCLVELTRRFTN
jgi:hypothetical protein